MPRKSPALYTVADYEIGAFMVRDAIVDRYGAKLNGTTFKVYMALARFSGPEHRAFPSLGTIAERMGLNRRNVQRSLRALAAEGLLRSSPRCTESGKTTSNEYILLTPPPPQTGAAAAPPAPELGAAVAPPAGAAAGTPAPELGAAVAPPAGAAVAPPSPDAGAAAAPPAPELGAAVAPPSPDAGAAAGTPAPEKPASYSPLVMGGRSAALPPISPIDLKGISFKEPGGAADAADPPEETPTGVNGDARTGAVGTVRAAAALDARAAAVLTAWQEETATPREAIGRGARAGAGTLAARAGSVAEALDYIRYRLAAGRSPDLAFCARDYAPAWRDSAARNGWEEGRPAGAADGRPAGAADGRPAAPAGAAEASPAGAADGPWAAVLAELRDTMAPANFARWLASTSLLEERAEELLIGAPDPVTLAILPRHAVAIGHAVAYVYGRPLALTFALTPNGGDRTGGG